MNHFHDHLLDCTVHLKVLGFLIQRTFSHLFFFFDRGILRKHTLDLFINAGIPYKVSILS